MEIIRAEKMGFCFGVSGAINLCNKIKNENLLEGNTYILGMLVHNKNVTKELEERGFLTITENELLNNKIKFSKKDTIIVRAHGTTEKIYDIMDRSGVKIYDATCVFVKKIRETLVAAEKQGRSIIFIGDKNHPEVKGIVSFGKNVIIVENLSELKNINIFPEKKYSLLTQTTLNKDLFLEIKEYIEKNYENVEIFSKICGATYERQKAVEKLASEVDLVFIIGDLLSSNSKKLHEISSKINLKSYLIQDKSEIKSEWLKGIKKIGITAGASTPEKIIIEIEKYIRGNFDDKHGL